MVRQSSALRLVLLLGDTAILIGSIHAAYWLRFAFFVIEARPLQSIDLYTRFSMLVGVTGTFLLYLAGHYRPKARLISIDVFFSLLREVTLTLVTAVVVAFLMGGHLVTSEGETQSRIVLVLGWGVCILWLTTWRGILSRMLRRYRERGIGLSQVLIAGADQAGRRFYDALKSQPHLGYNPIGFLDDGNPGHDHVIDPTLIIGTVHDLEMVVQTKWIDQLVVTQRHMQPETIASLIGICEKADIQFTMIPRFLEILTAQSQIYHVAGIPVVTVGDRASLRKNRIIKRALDQFLLLVLLPVAAPLLIPLIAAVALAIKLESEGPVLFRQMRVGKGGRPFSLLKFRSMCVDAEAQQEKLSHLNEAEGALFKIRKDPRMTRVGRIIRRYSIDELPQLINVLKGQMSLVGPRPPVPAETENYEDWQMKRFDLLPGMVGMPQVSGRSDLTFDEVIRLDLYYVENWSLLLDIKILIRAIPVVFGGRGAY